jgi:hypothetical protein
VNAHDPVGDLHADHAFSGDLRDEFRDHAGVEISLCLSGGSRPHGFDRCRYVTLLQERGLV